MSACLRTESGDHEYVRGLERDELACDVPDTSGLPTCSGLWRKRMGKVRPRLEDDNT